MEKYCQRHGRSDWSAANMSFLHKNLDVYGVGCSAQHYYFLFVTNKFDAFSTRESLTRVRRPGIISQIRVSLSSRAPIPFPISLITSDVLGFQSLPTRIHPMGDQRETHILAIKLLFSLSLSFNFTILDTIRLFVSAITGPAYYLHSIWIVTNSLSFFPSFKNLRTAYVASSLLNFISSVGESGSQSFPFFFFKRK